MKKEKLEIRNWKLKIENCKIENWKLQNWKLKTAKNINNVTEVSLTLTKIK
jgi:hypothetical protein